MRKTLGILCLVAAGFLYADQQGWIDIPVITPVVTDEFPDVPTTDNDRLHVFIVHSSDDLPRLSRSQLELVQGTRLKAWLNDQRADWRIWDENNPGNFDKEWFQKASQVKRNGLPWIVLRKQKKAYSGKLPETFDQTTELLSKYK